MSLLSVIKEEIKSAKKKSDKSSLSKRFKKKGKSTGRFTYEQCLQQIESGIYYQDSPSWVIKEIRRKMKEEARKIKSPEEEMDEYMQKLGGTPIDRGKARR
ncbi:MAG: hypothetical protein GTN73_08740 [Candidatus Aminicenantes bacterium]|nr:hypothetical protein [Candidatus Aminicenantes bacterium]